MKHKYFYSILLLAACLMGSLSATAQHKTVVYGNLGMENVNISINDTPYGTSTDAKGRYTLPLYNRSKTVQLYYSCISYQDTIVSLTPNQLQHDSINISFKMRPKNYALSEVTVSENKPEIAYHEKMISLVAYEINDMGLYLIAYRQSGNALLHLSFDLDTLSVLPIAKKYDRLYKDVFGQIHLMSYDSTYQIGHRQLGDTYLNMELFYGMTLRDFYRIMGNNVAATDSVFVIATYGSGYQELYYHYFNRGTPDAHLLEYTFDQEGLDLTENIKKFGLDGIIPPPPIYDPLFAVGDSLILFNFEANKIEFFDEKAQIIGEVPIKFHRYQKWDGTWPMKSNWYKMVLPDKTKKHFYAVFEDESILTLKKINLKTGEVKDVATLSGFQFVLLPRVNDGFLYFMFHTGITHSKALYRMRIE